MKIKHVGKLFFLFIVLVLNGQQAQADIYVQGVSGTYAGHQCPDSYFWMAYLLKSPSSPLIYFDSAASCPLQSNSYVPKTGYYKIETIISDINNHNNVIVDVSTSSFLLDATKTISQQTVYTSTISKSFTGSTSAQVFCPYLIDDSGHKYTEANPGDFCADGTTPLPPTPPAPDTSCTINSGNALNVNLGTVDRAQLPTVPGSGSMRHIPIPVDCTGGDVTVNVKINYTPITIGATQVVKSSSNGLGVSLVYSSKVISTTDTTPITFTTGSNSIDLAFQAVRDPMVEIKDIPTGAFTASAVLVMTQQ